MKKYRVSYSGFSYVEAETEEEAKEKFLYDIEEIYCEEQVNSVGEVEEFDVEID